MAALALGFASCSDDETIPNLTGIAIESEGGVTEVIQGGTLALTANYTSNVNPEVRWEVNGEVKSTDKEFSFTEAEPGKYYVTLVVSTDVGEKRVNLPVTVYGKYKYGTFVLNEGNFGNPPSSLIFISPEMK
ncbi:PKD-like domain-containing protein [Bacteroides fragilis]